MFHALARHVTDLQGRKRLCDLALHLPHEGAERGRDRAHAGVVLAHPCRIGGEIAGHAGDDAVILLAQILAEADRGADLIEKLVQPRREIVDLIAPRLNLAEHLIGEAGEFGGACAGDLHGHGKGAQIAQGLEHFVDMRLQGHAERRERAHAFLSRGLDARKHEQLLSGPAEIGNRGLDRIIAERGGDLVER